MTDRFPTLKEIAANSQSRDIFEITQEYNFILRDAINNVVAERGWSQDYAKELLEPLARRKLALSYCPSLLPEHELPADG